MQPAIIRRIVDRVAYARNGNAHNPTIIYRWSCASGPSFRTLREAKQALRDDFGVTTFVIERTGRP